MVLSFKLAKCFQIEVRIVGFDAWTELMRGSRKLFFRGGPTLTKCFFFFFFFFIVFLFLGRGGGGGSLMRGGRIQIPLLAGHQRFVGWPIMANAGLLAL